MRDSARARIWLIKSMGLSTEPFFGALGLSFGGRLLVAMLVLLLAVLPLVKSRIFGAVGVSSALSLWEEREGSGSTPNRASSFSEPPPSLGVSSEAAAAAAAAADIFLSERRRVSSPMTLSPGRAPPPLLLPLLRRWAERHAWRGDVDRDRGPLPPPTESSSPPPPLLLRRTR